MGGVPVRTSFVDEGAGGEAVLSEHRRRVDDVGVIAMIASISSRNCPKVAQGAEDLRVLNRLRDGGTQGIFQTIPQ